ncbi:hypothetical protein D3C75_1362960 [compost metagenome]
MQGQRIEKFHIERLDQGQWQAFYEGEIVGYKKICRFEPIKTDRIRICITESRGYPTLQAVQVYCAGEEQLNRQVE